MSLWRLSRGSWKREIEILLGTFSKRKKRNELRLVGVHQALELNLERKLRLERK